MNSVEIVNYSLAIMGVDPIMAFTDDTKVASVVNNIYYPALRDVLSLQDWNFALKRTKLNQLSVNEQSDLWQYAYQEPNDIVKIQSLRDSQNNKIEYEELGNVIYANVTPVYLRYVYFSEGQEPTFPPYFIKVLTYKLVMELSVSLQGNAQMYQFYDALYEKALREARGLDSIRGTPQYVDQSKWLLGLGSP